MIEQGQNGELPLVINKPGGRWGFPDIREMWHFRGLLFQMIYSDLHVRYKQTVMGFLWAVISPIITVIVYSLVFNRVVGIETEVPYVVFAFAGLAIWTFFARGLQSSSSSVVSYAGIMGKIYFPRIFAPLSKLFIGLVDFMVALLVLLVLMVALGFMPRIQFVTVPFFLLLAMMTALGAGLWLSALNVRFRDVNHVLPYVVQTMFFLTPVVYPSDLLSEPWRTLYGLNPMVTVCDGFRWALLGYEGFSMSAAVVSTVVAVVVFVSGLLFFNRLEKSFPDLI